MPASNIHKLSVIVTPAGQLYQLSERSIDPGIKALMIKGDGKLSPQFYANMEISPTAKFTTTAIAAALGTLGSGFYSFTAAVDMYMAQLAATGGIASGSNHKRITGTKGCIIPRRLRARHGGEATLDCDLYFISTDGTTAPLAYATGVALPTITVSNQGFTLGPAKINGSLLGTVTDLDITFGYKPLIIGSDGQTYPTFGGFDERSPSVSVKTKDPALLTAVTMGGAQQGVTPSVFYLRKMDPTSAGGRVADGTAQHIKLTVSAGFHAPGNVDDDDNKESELELRTSPLDDGTNDILAVSLASAIA